MLRGVHDNRHLSSYLNLIDNLKVFMIYMSIIKHKGACAKRLNKIIQGTFCGQNHKR